MAERSVAPNNSGVPQVASAEVEFSSGKQAKLGETLTVQDVGAAPNVIWSAEDAGFYTIVMRGPGQNKSDAKNEDTLYWMVVNIPGADISQGDTIVEYCAPRPSKSTQMYRYTISVYKQPEKQEFGQSKIAAKDTAGRAKFQVKAFAEKHNLGNPIAENSFKLKST